MKSIIQGDSEDRCYICGRAEWIERHHIFNGAANRKKSEIPFSVRAAECSLSGESIFSHDRNGKVAAAYEALTKEVTELEERAKNRPGPDWIR